MARSAELYELLVARLTAPSLLRDGRRHDYAYGLRVGRYRGARTVEHGGTMGGYRSYFLRVPEHGFAAVVLCNQLEISPNQLSHRLADHFLAEVLESRPGGVPEPFLRPRRVPDRAVWNGDSDLEQFVGVFESKELLHRVRLVIEDSRLVVSELSNRLHLTRLGEARFDLDGAEIRFQRDDSGAVAGFQLSAGAIRDIWYGRVDEGP